MIEIKLGDEVAFRSHPHIKGTVVQIRRIGREIDVATRETDAVRVSDDGGKSGIIGYARDFVK